MATASIKTRCVICEKEKATIRCSGCLEEFCYKHWEIHRQELNKQLEDIEINRDLFRQLLSEQIEQPNNSSWIQQINQWEEKSIEMIQQTAEQARQIILKNFRKYIRQIEINLGNLTNEIRLSREDEDFNEINLYEFQEELKRLTKELNKPADIIIRKESTTSIGKIWIDISRSTWKCNIHHNTRWKQNGISIAGSNGKGNELNQLHHPFAMYIDEDQTIYVADYENHRIMEWKCGASHGEIVAGGNGKGNQMNQLNHPTDVLLEKEGNSLIICDQDNRRVVQWYHQNERNGRTIISDVDCRRLTMDDDGYLYVSDRRRHEVRRWRIGDTSGTLVAGGNGKGNDLNQLNEPSFIFIDREHSVYVSDYQNHRVMKWTEGAKEGIVVTDRQGQGNSLPPLLHTQGLIVDHLDNVYVTDGDNHRIMRWFEEATEGSVIVGDNGKGEQANQLCDPRGISFDCHGNLYVVDCGNHRIQKFDIQQS